MRVVVALGGNALMRRGLPMTVENPRANVRTACDRVGPGEPDAYRQERQPEGEVHALPARLPRSEHDGESRDDGTHRNDVRARGDGRRVRVRGEHRVRPGREPASHDQDDPGRDAWLK